MFIFLVIFGWILFIVGAIVQIFAAIIQALVVAKVTLPGTIFDINDVFQKTIFKQDKIIDTLVGNGWAYAIIALLLFTALVTIALASFELARIIKGQRIAKPYIKMFFVALIIASLVFGKVSALIMPTFIFVGLLFIESTLFDVEAIRNYADERNMIIVYREDKRFEREVNKEGKYLGSVTSGVGATTVETADSATNFKNNDLINGDDNNNETSPITKKTLFRKAELDDIFNVANDKANEAEIANLINDMNRPAEAVQKPLPVKPSDLKNLPNEPVASPVASESKPQEAILQETVCFSPNTYDYKNDQPVAANANVEILTDHVEPVANHNPEEPVIVAPNEAEVVTSSIEENDVLTNNNVDSNLDEALNDIIESNYQVNYSKKEQKLFVKWEQLYQQAKNLQNEVDEEAQAVSQPTKAIKKKAKIYNNLAKEANTLANKLNLSPDKQLKLMQVTKIFGNASMSTEEFINDNVLDFNLDDVLSDDQPKQEPIEQEGYDFQEEVPTESENSFMTNTCYETSPTVSEDLMETIKENIAEDVFELLDDKQSSEDSLEERNNEEDDAESAFLKHLEQLDHGITEFNNLDNLSAELDDVLTNNFDKSQLDVPVTKPVKATSEEEKNDEVVPSVVTAEATPVGELLNEEVSSEEFVDEPTNETASSPVLAETLININIPSEPRTQDPVASEQVNAQLNFEDEVSYSLDELDNKIMNDDFSDLEDEDVLANLKKQSDNVRAASSQEQTPPVASEIQNPVFKQEPVSSPGFPTNQISEEISDLTTNQTAFASQFNNKIDKLEQLIINSTNTQLEQGQSLKKIQSNIKDLTMKLELLEKQANDLAKKFDEDELRQIELRRGVTPIDQFYPKVDGMSFASARYNLYNRTGCSNTYGALATTGVSHQSGDLYQNKDPKRKVQDILGTCMNRVDYNHINLHNVSKYTKQDIPYETDCQLCQKAKK
ncbi:hypothetical protein P344_00320 [Spiroplasma mirum ATCC 29335]|uniref:Uncharacterized protein n=1 Tax=Spiroplasma mirum ATCC 29335 TaxID=838561 RepID=W0GJU6_9MOLU|nr:MULTISPECIES: hypothetical protein [Spiroplasma]AHF60530.1 putative transmembrane protein [Spiroplasma mirum ATCC 29335]AHI57441.1 hypothetical protein P344_00320 [Spiroplasma mirum ATCC 29335]AKM52652.1 hypothetical protein SATRI_v1c00560 [Spiroplasma atrichopogonis]